MEQTVLSFDNKTLFERNTDHIKSIFHKNDQKSSKRQYACLLVKND